MGNERSFYDAKFYRELDATRESAREILPIVIELLHPGSIVDVGCGAGHWLATAIELGIDDVLGLDGDWALEAGLQIPPEKFLARDLSQPVRLERKFDLAIALEVGEHLPESSARAFVSMLCDAAHAVLFSAAIPGQGGRHHVNEQWPAYWAELFGKRGFECYDVIRPQVWENPRVLWYYAQNALLFAAAGSQKDLRAETPMALVHPKLWQTQIARLNSPAKLLERLIRVSFTPFSRKNR